MKIFSFIGLFLLSMCLFTYSLLNKEKTHPAEYNIKEEREITIKNYQKIFPELCWIEKESQASKEYDIYQILRFLNGVITGEYIDYLGLFLKTEEHLRLSYDEFLCLHKQMEEFVSLSNFDREEILDILSFGLILGELEKTSEFKNRAWIYNTESLVDSILLHDDIFPSMKRFTSDKKKFLCVVIESLQLAGFFGCYRNNIAYNISHENCFLQDNMKYFDVSFLMFICRLAGKYASSEKDTVRFTSGFFSFLNDFKEDLLIHLERAS